MSPLNPYEPPTIPAEVLEPPWPAGGAYSDGQYLVLHHATVLPPICVKTGRPAELEQATGKDTTDRLALTFGAADRHRWR